MSLGAYKSLLGFLRPFAGRAVGAGGLMLVGALLQLPAPLLTRYLFDRVIPEADPVRLNLFILALVALVLLGIAISLLQTRLLLACRYGAEAALRTQILKRFLGAKQSFMGPEASGYLVSRLDDDVAQIQHLFLDPLLTIALQSLTFVVGVGLLFHLHPRLAFVAILSLPAFVLTYTIFSRRVQGMMGARQESWARFRAHLQESIAQSTLLQAFSLKDVFGTRCDLLARSALEASRRFEFTQTLASTLTGLTAAALPVFILWYGIREILQGRFTVGGFIAFNTCVGYLYNPVRAMVSMRLDIQASMGAGQRVLDMLAAPQESMGFGSTPLEEFRSLDVRDLSFVYPGREGSGLQGVSFTLRAGDSLGIVGETGSGKSTLARLLLGFDAPSSGFININGRDFRDFDLASSRSQIGFVPQEPALFQGTILENLTLFDSTSDPLWVSALLDFCLLRESLDRFPQGMSTSVQEAGSGLSGGEKQRVAIARALYRKPGLLIVDEGTSAMDPETEGRILDQILNLPWRPAVLFITHRHALLERFGSVLRVSLPQSQ